MEFRDYPEWEELDLTPRPWPPPKKEKALKTNTRKKLLKELEQIIEEIKYDAYDYLGLRKKPFLEPGEEKTTPEEVSFSAELFGIFCFLAFIIGPPLLVLFCLWGSFFSHDTRPYLDLLPQTLGMYFVPFFSILFISIIKDLLDIEEGKTKRVNIKGGIYTSLAFGGIIFYILFLLYMIFWAE